MPKVQLKHQEAEVAKLERYNRQLLNERCEIDKKTMESIIRDLEESALVKRTQKQVCPTSAYEYIEGHLVCFLPRLYGEAKIYISLPLDQTAKPVKSSYH